MAIRAVIAMLIAATGGAGTAGAAVLRLGTVSATAGGPEVVLPMTITSGTGDTVASLQCDVVFDSAALTFGSVSAGPSATSAGKTVFSNVVRPGRVRCIVAGFNRTALPDGELLGVSLSVAAGVADNAYFVDIESAILSDPDGRPVAATVYYGAVLAGSAHMHSADFNRDWAIAVNELLRVIQFYNSRAYHCEASSEDGYAPGAGAQGCAFHDSDYRSPRNWAISVTELLRLIQLFNTKTYHVSPGSEDGFAPGLADRKYSAE